MRQLPLLDGNSGFGPMEDSREKTEQRCPPGWKMLKFRVLRPVPVRVPPVPEADRRLLHGDLHRPEYLP